MKTAALAYMMVVNHEREASGHGTEKSVDTSVARLHQMCC